MILPLLIWGGLAIFLGLQAVIIAFVLQQYRHPYAGPLWRRSWLWKGIMASVMVAKRLYWIMYVPLLPQEMALGDLAFDGFISGALALSLWYKAQIFRAEPPVIPDVLPALVVSDIQSRVLQWDTNAEALFGRKASEMLGENLIPLLIPERKRANHLAGMAQWVHLQESEWGVSRVIKTDALHKDGTEFPVEIAVLPVRGSDGSIECHAMIRRLVRL